MVVVKKTIGTSYVVAELDSSESQLRVAGFRLIPYFPRTSTLHSLDEFDASSDTSRDDPEDITYLESLSLSCRRYRTLPVPAL